MVLFVNSPIKKKNNNDDNGKSKVNIDYFTTIFYSSMPCHQNPDSLLQQSSQRLAKIFLATILDVEKVEALNGYLETLPSQLVEQVLDRSIKLYTCQCRRENVALEAVQFGCSGCLPSLAALIENQVTPSMTRLDFTYLIHLGTLSANAFACFHQILEHCLRKTGNNLTTLNLKSPNSRTSLPFVNSPHFSILSRNCQKLSYLDIRLGNFSRQINAVNS